MKQPFLQIRSCLLAESLARRAKERVDGLVQIIWDESAPLKGTEHPFYPDYLIMVDESMDAQVLANQLNDLFQRQLEVLKCKNSNDKGVQNILALPRPHVG